VEEALQIILNVLRQAWVAITFFIVSVGTLAMLAQVLRALGASTLGARLWVAESLASLAAIVVLVLVAFLCIPPVVRAVSASLPGDLGCGPIAELGMFASGLIAALVGVRILLSFARTIGGAALGGAAEIAQALGEAAEALLTMLLAGAAIPLSALFIGVCH
jgi:hypothetical protein